MRDEPLSQVHLGDGEEGGFWMVSFNELQIRHAGYEDAEIRTICVHVDETTGEMSLSDGYVPRSPEHQAENGLYDTYRDAIVREMVGDHRFKTRTAFLARHADDAFRRDESLAALDADLEETRDDED